MLKFRKECLFSDTKTNEYVIFMSLFLYLRQIKTSVMRIIIIALFTLTPIFASGQLDKSVELERSIDALEAANRTQSRQISELVKTNKELKSNVASMKDQVKQEVMRSQELQAQNERAMNLALDEFSKKFEVQNQTVKGVQDQLDEKFSSQLIIFLVAVVILIIISVAMNKSTMNKALKQNLASWNNFQEHILKK
jgi:alanyl-tRNA synthetase